MAPMVGIGPTVEINRWINSPLAFTFAYIGVNNVMVGDLRFELRKSKTMGLQPTDGVQAITSPEINKIWLEYQDSDLNTEWTDYKVLTALSLTFSVYSNNKWWEISELNQAKHKCCRGYSPVQLTKSYLLPK